MPNITFNGKSYACDPEKTVLDNLLEQGVFLRYSCMAGVCHSCLLQASSGTPSPASQIGLSPEQQENKCFLACQCLASEAMNIKQP